MVRRHRRLRLVLLQVLFGDERHDTEERNPDDPLHVVTALDRRVEQLHEVDLLVAVGVEDGVEALDDPLRVGALLRRLLLRLANCVS